MKPIRFLPFLAACLSLGVFDSSSFGKLPEKPKDRRKFRSTRDRMTKSIFGHRWSWNTPHVGAQQQARLDRRTIMDATAAANNYEGWCGNPDAGSARA